jgi:hypothetical protein
MSLYDKASIALIPSGFKATTGNLGKVYSVLPANGDGDFTHSRGSTATRVNKDGLIESVAIGEARLDYPLTNGLVGDCPHLLLEPSRTNISPDSERMDLWNSLRVTRTINSGVSPDGANTAVKVAMTATTGEHSVYDGVSVSSGTTYTNSIFIKRGTGSADWQYFQFRYRNGGFGTGGGVVIDIHNGTITYNSGLTDYGIENYGNGWYRVFITQTATTTSSSAGPVLAFNEISNGFDVNIVGNTNADVLLWGSQIEAGSYQTSYIKTSGGQVTRSADVCNNAGTSAQVNNDAGAFFVEIQALEEGSSASRRITLSDESTNNRLLIETDESTGTFKFFIVGGGNVRSIATSTGNTQTDINKLAIGYDGTSAKAYINGTQVGSITNATTRTGIDTIDIADWNGTSNIYFGRVKQVIYFNEALSDSELATLTS